jgi:preprotein translocase subunit SecG
METMLTLIHVLVALILIGLVLIQDSKGGALGIGGSTSNSLLGAGGAQTLAAKATRWIAVLFAVTSISLSIWTAKKTQSVVSGVLPVQAPVVPATTENSTGQVSPTQAAPTEASPAPSAPTTTEKK